MTKIKKGDTLEFRSDATPFLTVKIRAKVVNVNDGKVRVEFSDKSRGTFPINEVKNLKV